MPSSGSNGNESASPVIFGQKDDSTLLGVVSLKALGLILDPLKRELRSLPMVLGASRALTYVKGGVNL